MLHKIAKIFLILVIFFSFFCSLYFYNMLILLTIINFLIIALYGYKAKQIQIILYLRQIIAIFLLFFPLILISYLFIFVKMNLLFLIICWLIYQLFYLQPLFTLWGWATEIEKSKIPSLYTAPFFFEISIAMLYPILIIGYLSLTRYFRLGSTIDLNTNVAWLGSIPIDSILLVFICSYGLFIKPTIFIFDFVGDVREQIMVRFIRIRYTYHLKFLQKDRYFYFMEKCYKLSHAICAIIIQDSLIFKEKSFIAYAQLKIRKNFNLISFVSILLFISIEANSQNGQLYYSIYVLFFFPILRLIILGIINFYFHDWTGEVNYSDYINMNFENPRYPHIFWQTLETHVNYTWQDGRILWEQDIEKVKEKYGKKYLKVIRIYDHTRGCLRLQNYGYSWCNRMRFAYRQKNDGLRFMHTEAAQTTLHPLLSVFAGRTLSQQIALVKRSWFFYENWRQLAKYPQFRFFPIRNADIYNNKIITTDTIPDLKTFVEDHHIDVFRAKFSKYGIKVFAYQPNVKTENALGQKEPDMLLQHGDKYFVIDIKSNKNPKCGTNHWLLELDQKKYEATIIDFAKQYFGKTKQRLTVQQQQYLNELKKSCMQPEYHEQIWAECITKEIFGKAMPPMRMAEIIYTENFNSEIKAEILYNMKRHIPLSDVLHKYFPQYTERHTIADILKKEPLSQIEKTAAPFEELSCTFMIDISGR